MMSKGLFQRKGMTAIPAGDTGREALAAIRDGATFIADFRTARNPDQHEMFWTLCSIVAEAEDSDKETVKRWLLTKLNFVDVWFEPDTGRMHADPKSIAFESMEQAEFNRFFQQAVAVMSDRIGTKAKELHDRFEEVIAGRRGKAA